MSGMIGLAVVGFIALMIIIIVVSVIATQRARERRTAEFNQLAAPNGWQVVEQDDGYAKRWAGPPFTGRGAARNIVTGQHRGRDFCAFGYSYTTTSSTGQTTTTTTHSFAVVVIALAGPVPALSVGEEGIFGGKVAEAFGFERVDSGDEAFDAAFKVKCDDPAFGRTILTPAVTDYLKRTGTWEWRLAGTDFISYDTGVFEAAMVVPRLERASGLLDLLPAEVAAPRLR